MKKFLILLIFIGIMIGIITGVKSNKENINTEIISGDNIETNENVNNEKIILSIVEIDTLNPLQTHNSHVAYILNLIYEPLFTYDYENGVSNILVSEVSKKNDKTWLLKLKNNILWHDGNKLTTADVEFTINSLKNEKMNTPYKSNVNNIEYIDIVDENTMVITLNESDSYFTSKLTFPIVSKEYFGDSIYKSDEKSSNPIGTGPYKFCIETDDNINLSYNENWWNSKGEELKNIVIKKYATYNESIRAFKSLEIDMVYTNMSEWKEKFGFLGINSYSFENFNYNILLINNGKEKTSSKIFRKAIAHAINVNSISHILFNDNVFVSSIPLGNNSKYRIENYEYDVEQAKKYIEEAEINKKAKYTLLIPQDDQVKQKVAQHIQSDLAEIGVNVTIKEQLASEYAENIKKGNYELALATLKIQNEYQIQDTVKSGDTSNYSQYKNELMEQLILKLETSEEDVYDEHMKNFISYYNEEIPYIGLYFENSTILANKGVKGEYKSTIYNPYNNIMNFSK